MPSYDQYWRIERYPVYKNGNLESVSYGCPGINLMGYMTIENLLIDLKKVIRAIELIDFSQINGNQSTAQKDKKIIKTEIYEGN